MHGLSRLFGYQEYAQFAAAASKGKDYDLRIKDKIKGLENDFLGQFVIAHFGNVKNYLVENIAASIVHCAAVSTIDKVIDLSQIPKFQRDNIVYIGSTVASTPPLKEHLLKYTTALGKHPVFLEKGEFSLAMEAYHA